jgi:hypothetical protein
MMHSSIAQTNSDGYIYDTRAVVVRDGYSNCIRTTRWSPENAVVECDPDLFKQAAAPAIVATPATKPVIAPVSAVMPEGHLSIPANVVPEGHPAIPASVMPEGHPLVEATAAPDASAIDLPNEGKVVDFMDAGSYTYFQVTHKDKTRWLAAPKTPVVKGVVVRYGSGSVMHDFFSKSMNRNFPEIIFLSHIVVMSPGNKK